MALKKRAGKATIANNALVLETDDGRLYTIPLSQIDNLRTGEKEQARFADTTSPQYAPTRPPHALPSRSRRILKRMDLAKEVKQLASVSSEISSYLSGGMRYRIQEAARRIWTVVITVEGEYEEEQVTPPLAIDYRLSYYTDDDKEVDTREIIIHALTRLRFFVDSNIRFLPEHIRNSYETGMMTLQDTSKVHVSQNVEVYNYYIITLRESRLAVRDDIETEMYE